MYVKTPFRVNDYPVLYNPQTNDYAVDEYEYLRGLKPSEYWYLWVQSAVALMVRP